ncbi:glycerophosphodiester phosphodiesterase [Streptomyces sp. NP160]|uniref:glycerophosphodiester phosphodiesterase n=1 Tax=Streptomyces sp. NP160 TaxID=2586637 RepID=UPI00111A2475|nr:glycerophosphodiester phosphodiesterase [Streptomyces sp. NP160]TNM64302.1 glycerophosphodiester phosphodiesterase [Streptomyces sp. NP160]
MSRARTAVVVLVSAALAGGTAPAAVAADPSHGTGGGSLRLEPGTDRPLVLGHRGASAYRPEHTLAAYELAARMGADFIEPDLVSTKDGVLVDRHEPEISGTTDVADHPEFADRRATKTIDGVAHTGWFTEDFTLAELKTLRAVERLPELRQRNTPYDGAYEVPTFEEVLQLRERLSAELGREVGVIPEIKHGTYFDELGLSQEERVVQALRAHGLDREDAPAAVQSFEVGNLEELAGQVGTQLVQLTTPEGAPADLVAAGDPRTYADLTSPAGLALVARYADVLGPDKAQVVPLAADGTLGEPTSLVADAHAAGLAVVPYTFRPEDEFLPAELDRGDLPSDHGDAEAEVVDFLRAGVDGVFTDAPDTGVEGRARFLAEREG